MLALTPVGGLSILRILRAPEKCMLWWTAVPDMVPGSTDP